jgi:hypothetical protein
MLRHLVPPGPPRRAWFLSTREEIDAFFAERWATLRAMLEAERRAPEQTQLDLEEAA